MENDVPPSQKSVLLQQYHQRRASHIQPESPIEAYQARLKPVKARFREVTLEYARAGSVAVGGGGDDSSKAVLARFDRAFAELKEVSNQEETAKQQEREYQQNLEQDREAELREFLDLLGPSLSKRVYTQWFADQQAPPTPVQEQAEDIVEPSNTTTDSQFVLDPDTVEQPSRAAPPTTNPPPAADEACHSVASTSSQQKPPKPASATPNNKRTRSKSGSSRAKKRSRGDTHSGPLTNKVIEFEKVYQNGNAPKKYVIQEYHKHWYIFRCEEHDKEFPTPNPLLGAIRHLRGNWHYKGTTTVEAKMAIEELGTRVLDCDDRLAKKNNSVPRRSSYDQIGVPERSIRTRSDLAEDTDDNETPTRNTNGTRVSLIDPQPGEVYETLWDGDQDFYAALILPWGNFSQFGISNWDMSLKDTKLFDDTKTIPACYKEYDLSNGTFEWADAYRPGTSKASQRQYPVIYFEKPEFPGACRYGWANLSRLNTYDPDTSRVLHKSQVDKFLLDYANYRGGNAANAQGHAENGHDIAGPTPVNASPDIPHDRPPSIRYPSPEVEGSDLSVDESILLLDNDSEFERGLTARTRQNSSRVKEETTQTSLIDTTDAPVNLRGGPLSDPLVQATMPDDHQHVRASDHATSREQHDDHMEHEADANSANLDNMTTAEERMSSEWYHRWVKEQCQSLSSLLFNDMHQTLDDVPMSDNVQAEPSREAPVPSGIHANATMGAVETAFGTMPVHNELFRRNSVATAARSQRASPNREGQSPHSNSLPTTPHTQINQFPVPQSASVGRQGLFRLYSQLNRLSTSEGHGSLQRTIRSDGGTMWTLAPTPDETTRSSSSSRGQRQRGSRRGRRSRLGTNGRRYPLCLLPPRR